MMKTKLNQNVRQAVAFTLIELLAVIAIIAIVAAMVVSMGPAANAKKAKAMVEGERKGLEAVIENYHAKMGYYPLDNGALVSASLNNYDGLAATNPLLYELMGGTNVNTGAGQIVVPNFGSLGTLIPMRAYSNLFNRGGIGNADASEPHNFYQPGPKPNEVQQFLGYSICGLVVPVALNGAGTNNFWHYDSSSTNRHNLATYDLWGEYSVGKKNFTNGNW